MPDIREPIHRPIHYRFNPSREPGEPNAEDKNPAPAEDAGPRALGTGMLAFAPAPESPGLLKAREFIGQVGAARPVDALILLRNALHAAMKEPPSTQRADLLGDLVKAGLAKASAAPRDVATGHILALIGGKDLIANAAPREDVLKQLADSLFTVVHEGAAAGDWTPLADALHIVSRLSVHKPKHAGVEQLIGFLIGHLCVLEADAIRSMVRNGQLKDVIDSAYGCARLPNRDDFLDRASAVLLEFQGHAWDAIEDFESERLVLASVKRAPERLHRQAADQFPVALAGFKQRVALRILGMPTAPAPEGDKRMRQMSNWLKDFDPPAQLDAARAAAREAARRTFYEGL